MVALTRGKFDDLTALVAVGVLEVAVDDKLDGTLSDIATEANFPYRPRATWPTRDAVLHFSAPAVLAADGAARIPAIQDDTAQLGLTDITLNMQTGAYAGGVIKINGATTASPLTLPSMAQNQYGRVVFVQLSDGSIDSSWSSACASYGVLPNPGTLLASLDGNPVCVIDLQQTTSGTSNTYKTADSTTDIVEPAVGGNPRIWRFGSGSGVGGGATDFVLQKSVSLPASTVTIKKGRWKTADGKHLISGNVSADSPVNISLALTDIIATPAASTTHWLYIDLNAVTTSVTLSDTGDVAYPVYLASQFSLLTYGPSSGKVNPKRFIEVGHIKTPASTTWVGSVVGSSPYRLHSDLSAFVPIPEEFPYQTTTVSVALTVPHGLSGEPQLVQCYFYDASLGYKSALDISAHLISKDATNLVLNTGMLTFDTSDYFEVKAIFLPKVANSFMCATTNFKSSWFTGTGTTTVPHGLVNMDEIASYEVQEWDVTNTKRRNINRDALVINFDSTNFYLDWTGLSPTSTLQYRVVTGGTALPTASPIARTNQYTFTDMVSLTTSTTSYPLDIVNDEIGPISIMQMVASNKWQSVPAPDTVYAEKVGAIWYLRGSLSELACTPTEPVKITVGTTSPMMTTYPSILKYSALGQTISSVGTAGQLKQGHVLSAKSFTSLTGLYCWPLVSDLVDIIGAKTLTGSGVAFTASGIRGGSNNCITATAGSAALQSTDFTRASDTSSFAASLWAYLPWTSANMTGLLGGDGAVGADSCWELIANVGTLLFISNTTAGGGGAGARVTYLTIPVSFTDNSWHHIGLRYDGANVAVFVDGALVASAVVATIRLPSSGSGTRFNFGNSVGCNTNITGKFMCGTYQKNVAPSDIDMKKLASTRIDHNTLLPASRQSWFFNHYASGVAPVSELSGSNIILDKSDSSSAFVDFSNLDSTDKVDMKLLDL